MLISNAMNNQSSFNNLCICVLQAKKNAYSETFVINHVKYLGESTHHLCGGRVPAFDAKTGRCLAPLPLYWLSRVWRFIVKRRCNTIPFDEALVENGDTITRWAFRRYLKKHKIQVVLAEFGQTAASVWKECRRLGIPLVPHFHGRDVYHRLTLENHMVQYQDLLSFAPLAIVNSEKMRRHVAAWGCATEKLFNIQPGVDVDQFEKQSLEGKPYHFLFVGRFTEKKAPHLLILAFHQVNKIYPDARLVMIGDGDLMKVCRHLVKALGLCDAVTFAGVLSPQLVAETMKQSFALVHAAVTAEDGDMEGGPVSIIEAQACGLPVVASKHGGIEETVLNGITGILVEEWDIDGLAKGMLALINKPDLALEMGFRARLNVEQKYEVKQQVEKLRQVLINAVGIFKASHS